MVSFAIVVCSSMTSARMTVPGAVTVSWHWD
jgi:hypothetical protein